MPSGGAGERLGISAALLTVLVWAAYPVATRAGLQSSATPESLLALRFGVAAVGFLPYLLLVRASIPRSLWGEGVLLAILQGAGMAGLVIAGLQFAPASHAAALGPGVSHAWAALLGPLLFATVTSTRYRIGAIVSTAGALLFVAGGMAWNPGMLVGDAMFLVASALGTAYALRLRASGLSPAHGAMVVAVYSAIVVVPLHAFGVAPVLARMPVAELAWHVLWQGVLIGIVSLVAMNVAIARIGSERTCALFAMVPGASALLGAACLGEAPRPLEWIAIGLVSAGVAVAALPARGQRRAPQSGRPESRRAHANTAAGALSRPG